MSCSSLLYFSLSIWSLSLPCTYLVTNRRLLHRSWSQWPVSNLMTVSKRWYNDNNNSNLSLSTPSCLLIAPQTCFRSCLSLKIRGSGSSRAAPTGWVISCDKLICDCVLFKSYSCLSCTQCCTGSHSLVTHYMLYWQYWMYFLFYWLQCWSIQHFPPIYFC